MSLTRFHCANSLGLRGAGATRVYTPLQKIKAGLNKMTGTGFEPVPPKRLVPETSALDRSATQPLLGRTPQWCHRKFFFVFQKNKNKKSSITGNRTPGICVTGRDVTNYTMTDGQASSEDRTRDLALTKRMLCQLSYRGNRLLPTRIELATLGL